MGEDLSPPECYGKPTAKYEFTEFLKLCRTSIFMVFLDWLTLKTKRLQSFQKPMWLYLSKGRNILKDLKLLLLFSL